MNILDEIISESIDEELYNARNAINQNATDKQRGAGNYKKGHVKINGFSITIETPKGGHRSGHSKDGQKWSSQLSHDYGYFTKTRGHDGEHIDVFIGDDLESKNIYVIDQKIKGKFDKSKVMFCFDSIEKAREGYMSCYDEGWKGFWKITPVSMKLFRKWLYDGCKQRKPFFKYAEIIRSNKKNKMKKTINEEQLIWMINQALINEGVDEGFWRDLGDKASGYFNAGKNIVSNKLHGKNTDMSSVKGYANSVSTQKGKERELGNIMQGVEEGIQKGWFTGAHTLPVAQAFLKTLRNILSRGKADVSGWNNIAFGKYANPEAPEADAPEVDAPETPSAPRRDYSQGGEVGLSRSRVYDPQRDSIIARARSRRGRDIYSGGLNGGFGTALAESRMDNIIRNVINENLRRY